MRKVTDFLRGFVAGAAILGQFGLLWFLASDELPRIHHWLGLGCLVLYMIDWLDTLATHAGRIGIVTDPAASARVE
jgi:hypothetical protein